MIVRAEKQVENAVFPQRRSEKSAHEKAPPVFRIVPARSRFSSDTRKNKLKYFTTQERLCQRESCVFFDNLFLLKNAKTGDRT